MIIKILGTGAETTKPPKSYLGKYKPSCLILSPPVTILIDVGKDILKKATKEELLDVTHVLISHFHSDAVDGIPTFNKFLEENNKTVELYALPQVFERIKLRWSEKSYSNYLFVPISTKKPFKIVDHTIKALKVFHDPRFPTVAYNIDNVFVYMSDGGPIWDEYELKYFSNNILAILDGAYWDHQIPLNNHVAVLEHLDFILSLNNKYTLFTGMGNQWPCAVSPMTKVLTEHGFKPICKVKVGEKVYTHKGRLRKVIQKHVCSTKNTKIVTMYIPAAKGKRRSITNHKVTVTANHPIYVKRNGVWQWVPAEEVREGDIVKCLAKRCKYEGCNNLIPLTYTHSDYCKEHRHKACWTEELRRRVGEKTLQRFTKEKREEHSRIIKERVWSPEVRQKFLAVFPKAKQKAVETLRQRLKTDPELRNKFIENGYCLASCRKYHDTRIERIVEQWLKQNGIEYEKHKRIYYQPGSKRHIESDFFLPNHNVVIECDGEYWHSRKEYIERDKFKDKIYESLRLKCVRLSEKEILNYDFSKLSFIKPSFINSPPLFVEVPIKKVVHKTVKRVTRYNLAVEEDNSYILSYIVVHNSFREANKILKERLKKYKKEHPNCKIVEIRTAKEGEKLLIDLNKLYSQRDEFVLKPSFDTILNNPDILRRISKKELLMVHLRCHQLWAIKKTNKVLQVHVLVVKEMFRRGLKHRVINDLDKKTYRILGREIKVYEIWNELQDEIVIKSNIVRFVGSSLHKSDPNDLDIISPEVIYKAIKQFLKKYNPHYIGNEISHGDVLNVYDLVLKKKDSPNIVNPRLPDYTKFYKSCKIIPKLPFKSDTYVIEPLIKGKHGIVVDKKNRLIYEHVITDNNKEIITDLLAYRSDNLFKEIIINRLLFMHKKWLNKADRPFYLPIRWIVKKSKLWSFLSSIKNKYDAVIIRPATFRYYDGKFILHFKKEKYCCECLDCGYKMISDNHCKDIKCPRCNGEMRRCDRPGVGKSIQKDKKLKPLMKFPPLKATASSYHELEYFDPEEAWEYFCKFYVEQEGKVRAEYKIDGFRMIASQDANKKSLIYFEDAMKDVSSKLPSLVKELSTLHDSGIILDGELMEWDPNKNRWLSRHDLMKWSQAKKPGSDENVRVFVFDCLYYAGELPDELVDEIENYRKNKNAVSKRK